ncbi:MAG: hypothetical protein JWP03_4351 [Phycisphaerales bacterium]|jgi:hypothetical protein|nr:hypothetical protein [Phycisphaerales bacterium]
MENQRTKIAVFSVIAGLGLLCGQQASGSTVYSYIAQQQQYGGNPGDVISVNIYLQEQTTGGSFLATDGGLAQFGVAVNQLSADIPGSASKLTAANADTADFTIFNGPIENFVDAAGDSGQLGGNINGVLGAPGIEVGNGGPSVAIGNAVFLGTFSVEVGLGRTTFSLGAIDPINGGYTTTRNIVYDLDTQTDGNANPTNAYTGVGFRTTTFAIGFPEPSSLGVLALGGLLALRRRRA